MTDRMTSRRACADCNLAVAPVCPYKGALERGYQCPVVSKRCFWPEQTDGECYACSEWHNWFGCLYRGDVTLMGRLTDALRHRINALSTHGTRESWVPADFMEV